MSGDLEHLDEVVGALQRVRGRVGTLLCGRFTEYLVVLSELGARMFLPCLLPDELHTGSHRPLNRASDGVAPHLILDGELSLSYARPPLLDYAGLGLVVKSTGFGAGFRQD